MLTKSLRAAMLASTLAFSVAGCATAYYETLENFGIEKRDVLVDRVKDAKGAQKEAQVEFKDALEQFRSLVAVDGGELEKKYDKLSNAYDGANREAENVRERIASVKRVGNDLFREWNGELKQYSDPSLRARSEQQYRQTETEFKTLTNAMDRAAAKMDPVLDVYKDQVLFLKHNLNARAIASLELERSTIEQRVDALIKEMDAAIAEADTFIASMS